MEARTQKAAAQIIIDLTERLHEAEAQAELLCARVQARRLVQVPRPACPGTAPPRAWMQVPLTAAAPPRDITTPGALLHSAPCYASSYCVDGRKGRAACCCRYRLPAAHRPCCGRRQRRRL